MHQTCLCLGALLLVVNLCSSYPTGTGLSNEDTIILKYLLYNLEESIAEQTDVARPSPAQRDSLDGLDSEEPEDKQQPQKDLDEAIIRTFLSAKNLKSVRNNSSRNSSGCFGRRMDRIGSMSSLGCNTVGRYNPKSA